MDNYLAGWYDSVSAAYYAEEPEDNYGEDDVQEMYETMMEED